MKTKVIVPPTDDDYIFLDEVDNTDIIGVEINGEKRKQVIKLYNGNYILHEPGETNDVSLIPRVSQPSIEKLLRYLESYITDIYTFEGKTEFGRWAFGL